MPLLWLSIAFLLGVWMGAVLKWQIAAWAVMTAVALVLLLAQIALKRRIPGLPALNVRLPNPDGFPASYLPIFLLIFALGLGGLRYQMVQPRWEAGFIAHYNDLGSPLDVRGVVIRPVDERDLYTLLTVEAEVVRPAEAANDIPASGLLLARLPTGGDWRYGDRVTLTGELATPPEDEDFSYRDYLARQGVYAYIANGRASLVERGQGNRWLAGLYIFRNRALDTLYALFPDPEAALLAGILLGVETGIPNDVAQAFRDSGTSHIIAISGFNMAIVAGLFAALFGRLLGKRRGALAALIAISLYTLLVGASASVVRAAIMSGLSVFAAQVGRRGNGLNTLAIVASVMAFFNPNILWDVGFQLTFMATLGLVLYAGPLMEAFARLAGRFMQGERARRLAQPVGEYFLFSFAVLLPTLPVMVYHFQRLPLASLLANPMALPVQPALMILGGLALLVGMFLRPAGQLIAYLAWPLVAYTIRVAEFWARFRATIVDFGKVSGLAVLIFYAALLGLTFGLPAYRARARLAQSTQPAPAAQLGSGRWQTLKAWSARYTAPLLSTLLAGLAILTVLVWRAAFAAPDGRLHLTVLDVGSGDGLLIQTPGGRYVLVDGGSSPAALSAALGRRLPIGGRRLDALVVAGSEDEQIGSLPRVLERYPAGQVVWTGPSGGTRSARLLRETLAQAKIPLVEAESGQTLDLGDGARLEIISANRRGAVLLIDWKNLRALLPLSLDRAALETLQEENDLAEVTALLLSDGGYAPVNPPEWITRLHPQLVLLSVAAGDRRNLPDAEVMEAVEGYTLLRTDQNGWIEVSTDGQQMWVEVERK